MALTEDSRSGKDLATLWVTICFELPLAAQSALLGLSDRREMGATAWRAYDSCIRLANEATNRFYRTPGAGRLSASLLEACLRWQRLADALAGTFFSTLWPALGLPSAVEVQSLRAEIMALRDELHAALETRSQAEDGVGEFPLLLLPRGENGFRK